MQPLKSASIALILACLAAFSALAQQQKRISPHETLTNSIDGSQITIVYGRPYTKDPKTGEPRKIWGGIVPFGKVWRTGADEATTFGTAMPIVIGNTTVPAGVYSLFTLPQADGSAQLILNKTAVQWGAYTYDAKQDVLRTKLNKQDLGSAVEQFTMSVDKNPSGGGVVKLAWDNVQYSVPFTVKK